MDKYEFNIKTEQVKKLIRKKEYRAAAKIADSMDFGKVKNNALLITIADVYEVIGEYDKARDILVLAYERTQLGRQIAFRLARVSVKRKDLEEALEYYDDFVAVAPKDASRFILQYDISKLKGEPIESQIAILEQYVDDDMDDKWTFELAKLYHQAGNSEKCVEFCDTIILWFNEGKYVDKAMELKMLHAPLTKSQQEKYDSRWEAKEQDININEIKVKEINVDNKYDTYNIQAEIAKSMVELLGKDSDSTADIFKPASNLEATKVALSQEFSEDMSDNGVQTEMFSDSVDMDDEKYSQGAEHEAVDCEGVEHEAANVDGDQSVVEDDQIEGQITLDELLTGMYAPTDEEDMPLTEIDEMISSIASKEKADMEAAKATRTDFEELDKVIDAMEEFSEESVVANANVSEEPEEDAKEVEEASMEPEDEIDELEENVEEPIEEPAEDSTEDEMEENVEEPTEDTNESDDKIEEMEANNEPINAKKLIKDFIEHYSGVEGLDKQIIKTFKSMLSNNNEKNDYLYIMGDVKSGKTTLAMEIIKLVSKIRGTETKKVAKVNGSSITIKNVDTFTDKLADCNVIIEKAASIDGEIFSKLTQKLNENETKRIVVFEDEKTVSERYMEENKEVEEFFEDIIKLKHNRIRDWANIAIEYAKSQGYTIDEMGMLALHAKIDQLYAITLVIHKNHVEQLVDIAIAKSNKKSIGKLIKGVFKKNNEEKVLTESDFIKD